MSEQETQASSGSKAEQPNCFCLGVGPELFALFRKLGPDSARQHFRNARIEMLKGMRELIDKRIEQLSGSTENKGTKIHVE